MSVNKYAVTRYHILDRCFSNPGRRFYINDLLVECNSRLAEAYPESDGIKIRQLYDDIAFMQSPEGYNAPIEKYAVGKRKFYRYGVPDFSINNQPLNASELAQIRSALEIISRFKGMPQFEWVNEFMPKLEQAFTIDKSIKPIIGFDSNEYLKGIHWLGELFNAILYKKVLGISYRSFKVEGTQRFIIHPYFLKQYNNRWFIFGHNTHLSRLTNLALDRIEHIEEEDLPYVENIRHDFNEFFEDLIGVSKYEDAELIEIMIQVEKHAAPYILSKPLHGSQKVKQKEPVLIISIEVIPNPELETVLLSFGERLRVLSPVTLRKKLAGRLRLALSAYTIDTK